MKLTAEHELAMYCLPIDGRWQTEAQLRGQTLLGLRTHGLYEDLLRAGYCERKGVPVICGQVVAAEETILYRCTWSMRRIYTRELTRQKVKRYER